MGQRIPVASPPDAMHDQVEGFSSFAIRKTLGEVVATVWRRSKVKNMILVIVLASTLGLPLTAIGETGEPIVGPVATFSILGYDPETGLLGAAVQSRVFSVGNGVLWGEAGVGIVATQAIVDVSYGPQALDLLRENVAPEDIVRIIWERDPDPGYLDYDWPKSGRQFAVMNADGDVAVFTGKEASEWAGHEIGKFVSAQGNILAGPEVVKSMVAAFEATDGHLSLRLMAALEAGQAAGGDTRGMQSAAMLIVKEDGGIWLNNDVVLRLQVDDHEQPIAELRRLVEKAHEYFEWPNDTE